MALMPPVGGVDADPTGTIGNPLGRGRPPMVVAVARRATTLDPARRPTARGLDGDGGCPRGGQVSSHSVSSHSVSNHSVSNHAAKEKVSMLPQSGTEDRDFDTAETAPTPRRRRWGPFGRPPLAAPDDPSTAASPAADPDAEAAPGEAVSRGTVSRGTGLGDRTEDAVPVETASDLVSIAACADREAVHLGGTLRTVVARRRKNTPTLHAELRDATGSVLLIWLGRRDIPGIHPGRRVRVRGRITTVRGRRVIYNPHYELRPPGAGAE